jgi:hypothetical protein
MPVRAALYAAEVLPPLPPDPDFPLLLHAAAVSPTAATRAEAATIFLLRIA